MCLRQLYKRKEIAKIKQIKRNTNPADFITKLKAYNALKQLIDMNKVNISVIEWVERNFASIGIIIIFLASLIQVRGNMQ